jgi:hypothetical protein
MDVRGAKVRKAMDALALLQLNAAERLRVSERLMDDVLASMSPLVEPVMCTAEGMLQVASDATENAREIIERWPQDDLPVSL